ncbi:MAG TPA: hypothetical protein VK890_08325 [Bacteroidia bacterium]|jgi:hypothetical protein|nr:hypothetical protein [Bacteroidia bacterium]
MKKSILIYLAFSSIIFSVHGQDIRDKNAKKNILSGIGIAGGLTYGTQLWDPEGPLGQERYILRTNIAAIAEFFHHPIYRWRAELGYNLMGTTELLYIPAGQKVKNKTNYISFNNYLKINFRQTGFVPYFLIGPRIEYLLIRRAAIYQDVIHNFYPFHVTGAIGIGAELMWKSSFRPFAELLYNHDIMASYYSYYADGLTPTTIDYNAFELRIGLKYFFDGNKKDACPKVYNPMGN